MATLDNERLVADEEIPLMLEKDVLDPDPNVSALAVGFGWVEEYDEEKSTEAGKAEYAKRVFFSCKVPGDKNTHIHTHAKESHFQRFPRAYAAFKSNSIEPSDGLPLTQWGVIPKSRAQIFKRDNIRTVEDLCAVSDAHIDKLGYDARPLRAKARAEIELRKDAAVTLRLAAENDAQKDGEWRNCASRSRRWRRAFGEKAKRSKDAAA